MTSYVVRLVTILLSCHIEMQCQFTAVFFSRDKVRHK